jgi:phosphoglycerol transferase MdoB-like AlkP superfamily enzyme
MHLTLFEIEQLILVLSEKERPGMDQLLEKLETFRNDFVNNAVTQTLKRSPFEDVLEGKGEDEQ